VAPAAASPSKDKLSGAEGLEFLEKSAYKNGSP